jgi:hypothetical protein
MLSVLSPDVASLLAFIGRPVFKVRLGLQESWAAYLEVSCKFYKMAIHQQTEQNIMLSLIDCGYSRNYVMFSIMSK